jgi:SOS-response transcriptional repressor LexA
VKERQEVQVRLYDVLGRRVATLHSGPLPAQELRRLRLDVSATGLTSGTYFLRVTGEDFAATRQMTVVR